MAEERRASRGEYVAHLVNELVKLCGLPTDDVSREEGFYYKSLLAEIARAVDGGEVPETRR